MPLPVVLITSTGRASRHLITTLLSLPECPTIRLIASPTAASQGSFPSQLRSTPNSVIVTDSYHGREFETIFRGVDVVFHNGPSLNAQEEALGIAVIDAAKEADVKHFILCSVFDPVRVKLHFHKIKLHLEEYLVESRLDYTILQPAHYMQNVALDKVIRTGKIPLGYSSSIVHGFVDLTDLTLITRNVILHPEQHKKARYELVSENISYDDIAQIIARISRRNIECDVMSSKEFIARMKATGELKNEFAEDAIERLMLYYNRWGLTGNSNVIRWLLGREPTSWEHYMRREVQHRA